MQFVAIFVHQFQLLFRDCDYPKGFMVWIGLHGVMFLFLFSDFYKAKYSAKRRSKTAVQNGKVTANGAGEPVTSNKGACMVSSKYNRVISIQSIPWFFFNTR